MTNMPNEPTISVVIPMFNEEQVLPLLAERLRPAVERPKEPYEIVAVDDGSTDATFAVLHVLRENWPQLRVIGLRRNVGQLAALSAGLHRILGSYVVTLDADLQDPPEVIAQMLALARDQQLDVVYGVRADRASDSLFKRYTADLFYRLQRRLVGGHVPMHACDFRLLSRAAVDALNRLPERAPIYRLLVPWMGFPSGEVQFVRDKRAAGQTKYSVRALLRIAFSVIANFSPRPLRLATWLGVALLALSVMLGATVAVAAVLGLGVSGWMLVGVSTLFVGALQLFCLGVMGEYVSQLHASSQDRPLYFIASDTGMDPWLAEERPGALAGR